MNRTGLPARPGIRPPKVADPGGRICELWAIVAIDEDGDETLVMRRETFGTWCPLVTADGRALDLMMAQAKEMLREHRHLRVEVRHFETDAVTKVLAVPSLQLSGMRRRD